MIKEQFNSHEWTLVWENASPTSAFPAQTISIDLSKYNEVAIVTRAYTTLEHQDISFSLIDGSLIPMFHITRFTTSAAMRMARRECTPTATGMTFTEALIKNTNVTTAGTTENNFVIPCYIYAR